MHFNLTKGKCKKILSTKCTKFWDDILDLHNLPCVLSSKVNTNAASSGDDRASSNAHADTNSMQVCYKPNKKQYIVPCG